MSHLEILVDGPLGGVTVKPLTDGIYAIVREGRIASTVYTLAGALDVARRLVGGHAS